ncbi:MFS transporter [Iamia majanohamensis]|uniref:MFS transporter n=1 Tax=Iamia majanohamensis TaxID=467976 RepID=A0AAE9YCM5_9ACTN|nr:MFS transporter [Iamia majanohamensis]WCO68743.1 MFS transporter [Iamia majanohamensis]
MTAGAGSAEAGEERVPAAKGGVPGTGADGDAAVAVAAADVEPDPGPASGWLRRRLTDGAPVMPLLILFGLNLTDELDRSAFGVLLPNIRDDFDLSNSGILGLVALSAAAALLLTVPIAAWADRGNRVRIALLGAAAWAFFSLGTGLAFTAWVLVAMRSGSSIGQAVNFPTHNSLLSDYYKPELRPRVYSLHRSANAFGVVLGAVLGAGLAQIAGWRTPFFVFAVPTALLVVLGLRLRDPGRGHHERAAMGADAELLGVDEPPPSFAEAYRMVWTIDSLRRIFVALPFLAASIAGFVSISSILYEQVWGLDEVERSWVLIPVQLVELGGLALGARIGMKALARGPSHVFRFIGLASFLAAGLSIVLATAPRLWVAIVANSLIVACLAIVGPGVLSSLSLAIPPRARSIGFSIGALFVLPGLLVLPVIGWIGDAHGFRWGIAVIAPIYVVGGLLISSVGSVIDGDVHQVWAGAAARAELLRERRAGRQKLLLVRGLDVRYGDIRILFGVDVEVEEGEVVALLGTNGAGKSTLLNAISGVVPASRGAVIFDGRDITHAPPEEIALLGIGQVPGGKGVFPGLTVAENLRVAGWMARRDPGALAGRRARVDAMFPVLVERRDDVAANLSGGQQQMLALSMAFLTRPKLLVIDELSLGLAPVVVEQLLDVVRALRDEGTTILLVEQSVNVALSVADRAYFLEKGEVRFDGPTADLLDRPDVLRSVFLEGATKGLAEVAPPSGNGHDRAAPVGGLGVGPTDQGTPDEDEVLRLAAASASPLLQGARGAERDQGPGLVARDLSVRFGGVVAVAGVSLDLAPGEVLGLVGPNGAGKTTLIDLLSGHTRADSGTVALGDRDLTRMGAGARARAGMGRSFQDSRLFPSLTVEEAVAVALERWVGVRDPLNAALRTPPLVTSEAAVAAEVTQLIDLLGLEAFRSKFVGELSTGSRRIVDLACVLAHRPDVVLLDEPSSGIAQREAEALGPLLLRIRDALGASLVVIEHDMSLITSVSDRLIALDQGRVVTDGPPDEVLRHPEVVAAYLGTDEAVLTRSGPTRDHIDEGP